MSRQDELLAKFIEEWNAGRRPSVEEYIDQAPTGDPRDDLAEQISTFLSFAPSPRYDETAMESLREQPAVRASVEAFEAEESVWPSLLPKLRKQAGLSREDLARQLLSSAGLEEGGQRKAAQRIGEMESGELDATTVSERLLSLLSRILGINEADLWRTGMPAVRRPSAQPVFRRSSDAKEDVGEAIDLLADALATPADRAAFDDVDQLFFG